MARTGSSDEIHLYAEEYDPYSGDLWLDFVRMEDFYSFFGNDINDGSGYMPSMIYVRGLRPGDQKERIRTGDVLSVSRNALHPLLDDPVFFDMERADVPASVRLMPSADRFSYMLREGAARNLGRRAGGRDFLPEPQIAEKLNRNWIGGPCAAENLAAPFQLSVWDVGQGNTNSLSDGKNLTLFDLGCSINYTRAQQVQILDRHADFIGKHARVTLIVSHWDLDHYNLLCNADTDLIESLCCVFVPLQPMGVTAKQILNRLAAHCRFVKALAPFQKSAGGANHMHAVRRGRNYDLFIGERSADKNRSGLAMYVTGGKEAVFLTADHDNDQIWGDMYAGFRRRSQNALHAVVPHHGGRCGKPSVPPCVHPLKAAVSVGKNTYKHPNQHVMDVYQTAGFELLRTDWERSDIGISVR